MSGNVKCPIHGEHGNSANGQCWYCNASGLTPSTIPIPPRPATENKVVLAYKEK